VAQGKATFIQFIPKKLYTDSQFFNQKLIMSHQS
jgi:hypothetical protein